MKSFDKIMNHTECDICARPIRFRVINSCGHCDLCIACYIQLGSFYNTEGQCYFCQKKNESEPCVVQADAVDYQQAKIQCINHNEKYHFYFSLQNTPNIDEYISSLTSLHCPNQLCNQRFENFDVFNTHLKTHKLKACSICWNSHRFLASDVQIFSQKEYSEHMQHHPQCQFCHQRIFDQGSYQQHMKINHISCDICSFQGKIIWLKNEQELIQHNEKEHFVCYYPQCSSESLIAFGTRKELYDHLRTVHNEEPDEAENFYDDLPNPDEIRKQEIEKQAHIASLKSQFLEKANSLLPPQSVSQLKNLLVNFRNDRISPKDFFENYSTICGNHANSLFVNVVALLNNPEKRIQLIKIAQGTDQIPKQETTPENTSSAPPPQAPPVGGKKKKNKKKIVLFT